MARSVAPRLTSRFSRFHVFTQTADLRGTSGTRELFALLLQLSCDLNTVCLFPRSAELITQDSVRVSDREGDRGETAREAAP